MCAVFACGFAVFACGFGDPLRARVGALLAGRHERLGSAPLASRDLLHAATGGDRTVAPEQGGVTLAFKAVTMLDQQPIVPRAVPGFRLHTHQNPATLELLAGEQKFELPG